MDRILVGYDGSEAADHALQTACRVAAATGASLTVLTAEADRLLSEHHGGLHTSEDTLGRRVAGAGAVRAHELGVQQVDARTSVEAPDDALVLAAQEGYDLVVVGHRGLSVLQEIVLGSTAKSVVDRAPCSVLVVR
jgi:nucleotide-binding universal stress UspA family protein